ncbi:hypothetical protein K9M79_07940 [Candidatus Woesearchaeota archaeon]|nr:hypothetical protein [Candidatus Woesearchaeota archaeon]
MESIEVSIYMVSAVIIGSLLLVFLTNIEYDFDDSSNKFINIEKEKFPQEVLNTWIECGMGEAHLNRTIYVKGNGNVNKSYVFKVLRGIDFCNSLQSVDEGCGDYEHLDFTSLISLPALIRMECTSLGIKVK